MKTLIRSPRGAGRREVAVASIQVPDLWHVAMWLNENQPDSGHHHLGAMTPGEAVLECWHLCHDLLEHIKYTGKEES